MHSGEEPPGHAVAGQLLTQLVVAVQDAEVGVLF